MHPVMALNLLSLGYLGVAAWQVGKLRQKTRVRSTPKTWQPPVTVFKPVCGLSAKLDDNLRSFCSQDYPDFQILFGVQDPFDPAIEVIRGIIREFPRLDLKLVIDQRLHGSNYKVSNLMNLFTAASHDIFVISDDDVCVSPNYLSNVVAPFADPVTGAVTCLYSSRPEGGGIASSLNAMFINEWFMPSLLISSAVRETRFCLGATMAVRRETLDRIGGFEVLADHLADDYLLGKKVSGVGCRVTLLPHLVQHVICESGLKAMLLHELRWARTMRNVEPLGYACTFITDTLMVSILTGGLDMLLTGERLQPAVVIACTLLARLLYHEHVMSVLRLPDMGSRWLVPFRDLLSLLIRILGITGNRVEWKDRAFAMDKAGRLHVLTHARQARPPLAEAAE